MAAAREGNLEAPTRHPIDWKNPEYYNEKATFDELERIFDICHGCRRCVSLCGSFPTLFDLIDESKSGEVDSVERKEVGSHDVAMKIGKPLFKKMAEHPQGGQPDYISSDCPLGGHHIDQGFDLNALGTPQLEHPLTLVRMAYGIE